MGVLGAEHRTCRGDGGFGRGICRAWVSGYRQRCLPARARAPCVTATWVRDPRSTLGIASHAGLQSRAVQQMIQVDTKPSHPWRGSHPRGAWVATLYVVPLRPPLTAPRSHASLAGRPSGTVGARVYGGISETRWGSWRGYLQAADAIYPAGGKGRAGFGFPAERCTHLAGDRGSACGGPRRDCACGSRPLLREACSRTGPSGSFAVLPSNTGRRSGQGAVDCSWIEGGLYGP